MKTKNNDINILFERIFSLIRTNLSLFFIYPLIVFLNFNAIKLFSEYGNLKLYLLIVLISQFEVGYIKEVYVKNNRLYVRDLLILLVSSVILVSVLIYFLTEYFDIPFSLNFILVLIMGIVLNEIKAFFDSQKKYDLGFLIKSILLILIPFIFLLGKSVYIFIVLFLLLSSFLILLYFFISKLPHHNFVRLNDNFNFYRFFIINFFSFFGGNIDRFLIYPNSTKLFFDQYVVLTESNSKVNSAFGFFNNLFLFGHLVLNKYLVIAIFVMLNFCFLFIHYYFDLDYEYYVFSLSTLFSILGQYFIFSMLKDIKHTSSSFFSAIGIITFLICFVVVKFFFEITIYSITLMLVIKTISEIAFLYLIKK